METAASALSELAKGAASSGMEDEWEIFGKDVANSIRALDNKDLQRWVKFAVQSAIFQATDHVTQLQHTHSPTVVAYSRFSTPPAFQDINNGSYHGY